MAKNSHGVLIIPSLNPDEKTVATVTGACGYFDDVILVNDGSRESALKYFDEIKQLFGDKIHLLTHEKNLGKGSALKTAFRYFVQSSLKDEYVGVITADGDGQHGMEDIIAIDKGLGMHHTRAFHIGQRNIDDPIVPPRSRFGNKSSAAIFRTLYGTRIDDTQTGLRAFSTDLIPWLLSVRGSKFEYEMNVLIGATSADMQFYSYSIATKYEPDHKSTYRTLRDGTRVFFSLLGGIVKYICAGLISAATDVGLFYLFRFVIFSALAPELSLLVATVLARASSSVVNFICNRFVTFGGKGKQVSRSSILKYYTLWFLQMGTSYGIVLGLSTLAGNGQVATTLIKAFTDLILSFISYQVQLRWVFQKKEKKSIIYLNVTK